MLKAWKIKHQILSAGLVSLLVVLGIIYSFYTFTSGALTENSTQLIDLTTRQYGEGVARTLDDHSKAFVDWSRDDIFGLSIEFSTTGELKGTFEQWLTAEPGVALLALVDNSGTVIESAWNPAFTGEKRSLVGSRLEELSRVSGSGDLAAAFVNSPTIEASAVNWKSTYVCRRWAYSSSGDKNGAFVAFMDWGEIVQSLDDCRESLVEYHYTDAQVALGLRGAGEPLARAGNASSWQAADLSTWQSGLAGNRRSGVSEETAGETELYVGYFPLKSPNAILSGDNDAADMTLAAAVPVATVTAQLQSKVISILLIGLFGICLVAGLSWLVASRISKRLNQITTVAIGLSRGDIDYDLKIESKDEVGVLADAFGELAEYIAEMAGVAKKIAQRDLTVAVLPRSDRDQLGQSFSSMVENLSGVIRQLSDNARELSSAGAEISSTSEEMAKGVSAQSQRIDEISTTIEEMTATIMQSSTNAKEASSASQTASDTADSGGETVRATISGMQAIADVTRKSSQSIAELASSADEIGRIVSVIDDIADQTNLLALNAAIEAARAGEQGRGFAVVADEVRKLAERTSTATAEIGQMIRGIQARTEEAVNSAEAGVQEIDKGRELADKAGNSLTEIVTVSQRVKEMIVQIAAASAEQSTAAEQMSQAIQQIASTTKQTSEGATQSAAAAEELNRQAESLEKIVAQFQLR